MKSAENIIKPYKKQIVIAAAAAILFIAVMVVLIGRGKSGYRLIKIYELNGNVTVEREKIGAMDAYENLTLLDKDILSVLKNSYTRLKMDEDKYVLAEEGSVLQIYATGNNENSKTDIHLQKGDITVEIQNKLSDKSSYQITTPNSVMAVRGTIFHVRVETDEQGKPVTKVAVFEGKVTARKLEEGAAAKEEPLEIDTGTGAIIASMGAEENSGVEITVLDEVDFTDFSDNVLEYLHDVSESGRPLCRSSEEIGEMIAVREEAKKQEETPKEQENTEKPKKETEALQDSEKADGEETEQDAQKVKPSAAAEASKTPAVTEETSVPAVTEEKKNEETKKSDGGSSGHHSEQPSQPQQPKSYTVTFMYDGKVFGTQKVEAGHCASEPVLLPAASGKWCQISATEATVFDFNNTPIQGNIELRFVQSETP